MGHRLRFLLAQAVWIITAFGLALIVDRYASPAAVIFPIFTSFLITGILANWGSGDKSNVQQQNDNIAIRALVSGFMWLIFVGAIIGGTMSIGAVMIPLAVIMMIPLLALSSFMWKPDKDRKFAAMAYVNDTASQEKRKRDRVDAMIRDLSDEELIRLKQRLEYGDLNDEDLKYMLSDDGELVSMDERKRRQ